MNPKLKNLILNNSEFYCSKFLKIKTKSGELKNFVFNPAQKKVDKIVTDLQRKGKPVKLILLKARQLGMSTYVGGKKFHRTATRPFVNSMIIAHEDKATQNLFNMHKLFYDELPERIRPMKKYSNGTELVFENPTSDPDEKKRNPGLRSKITVATAKNVRTARSQTIHYLHCSEVAFWEDPDTLMLGLLQCVPDTPNTMIVIESTANGVGNWFHRMWQAAEKGENDFVPIFLGWYEDPEYTRPFDTPEQKEAFIKEVNAVFKDSKGNEVHTPEWELMQRYNLTYEQLNWRRYTIKNKCNGDEELFCQEYPSNPNEAFIASGRPRFNTSVLKQYARQTKPGERGYLEEKNGIIRFIPDPKGYLEVWEKPVQDKSYCIGADVAEGLINGDYSAACVGGDDLKIICSWHGHIDPDLFGYELYKLGTWYNQAYIGVECNNHGLTTLKSLQSYDYYNIYWQKVYNQLNDKITKKIGWRTDKRTKPLMINKLAEFIRERYLWIKWQKLIDECFTYIIEDDGSTNAQEGCHDDTVMATAIWLQMVLEGVGEDYAPEQMPEGGTRQPRRHFDDVGGASYEDEVMDLEIAE